MIKQSVYFPWQSPTFTTHTLRQGILLNTKARRVGEVVRELTHELEDVAIVGVARDRHLGLKRRHRNVRYSSEWRWVGLGQECRRAGGSRT